METLLIAGTGPSCSPCQLDFARGKCRVLVISDNYKLAPWADYLYAPDFLWWKYHKAARNFAGEKWTIDRDAANEFDLLYVRSCAKPGLSLDPNVIHQGDHAGFQCVNLAVAWGYKRIALIGYDCGATGDTHNFGDHPPEIPGGRDFGEWLAYYPQLAADCLFRGIEVINCTPATAITSFRRAPLRDVL